MSHFTVMVVTASGSQDEIAKALQPFHEFECTGTNDQYVVDVDKTAEAMEAWKKATEVRLKAPDGSLHNRFTKEGAWDHRFSVLDPDALSWRSDQRIEFVPAGWERVEVPASECEAAADWISDYYGWPISGEGAASEYGYVEIDADRNVVKCVDRTNPNAKWDWWVVGGRWSDSLLLNGGKTADSARIGDLDVETMRRSAADEAGALWDKVSVALAGVKNPEAWDSITARHKPDFAAAREEYHAQPGIIALKAAFPDSWGLDDELYAANMTRNEFREFKADSRLATFALLVDGQWFQRGEMGWWACVSDDVGQAKWNREFNKKISELSSDTWVTMVDCHI